MTRPVLAFALLAASCGAPPWQMGAPLDGHPSIPPRTARPSFDEARAAAVAARAANRPVLELSALGELAWLACCDVSHATGTLTRAEKARLFDLLVARAASFREMGRAIPESADLEKAAGFDARGAALAPLRAHAAVAAGDAWKALGAREEAGAAYARAAALGGVPGGTGGAVRPRPRPAPPPSSSSSPSGPPPADVQAWVLGAPALSARLLPLVSVFPWLLDDLPRALEWAELLLAEDPTSPEVRELCAVIFGRARRFGGTSRMLMELAYYSPDRAAGLARGAAVWEAVGRPREACAQWIRAARWRDLPDDPAWRKAIACSRRDPGAGDWREIRAYVVGRAGADQRPAIAASLDEAAGIGGGVAAGLDAGAGAGAGTDGGTPAGDGGVTGLGPPR